MGLKRNLVLAFVVLMVLGGISSQLMPTEEDDNVKSETTKTESEINRTEGTLTVQDVWWTKNGNKVTEVEQGDTVKANIELIANNGNVDGILTVKIREDKVSWVDSDHETRKYNIDMIKDSKNVISIPFTAEEVSDSTFRGYYLELEGVYSWTMEKKYPPGLFVNDPEPDPEARWRNIAVYNVKNLDYYQSAKFSVPENAEKIRLTFDITVDNPSGQYVIMGTLMNEEGRKWGFQWTKGLSHTQEFGGTIGDINLSLLMTLAHATLTVEWYGVL